MDIIQVISSLDKIYGGPSRSVPHLCQSLTKNNCDVTLLSLKSKTPNIPSSSTRVKTKLFDYLPPRKLSYSSPLIKELEKAQCDIFHGHGLWQLPTHYMAKVSRKRKIPYLITPRGMLEPWALQQSKFKKRIFFKLFQYTDLKQATCLHATAKNEYESIRKLGLTNPVAIIPNGINTNTYSPIPISNKRQKDKRRILFLSRIHKKKGINFLIEAWSKVHTNFPDWEVLIVGIDEDSYRSVIERQIYSLKLENSIKISEPIYGKAKVKLYQESDLFVLPTHSENYGIVIAEALSCGLPVITTKGTPWEELNQLNAGWWIDIGTHPLIKALKTALSLDDKEREKMGTLGRKLICEKYSIESTGKMMKDVYSWILNEGPLPACVTIS